MDLVGYSGYSSEGERDNDLSLLGNLSRHPSYLTHPSSPSNESNQSVSHSLVKELSFVKGRLEEERDKLKEWEGQLRQREERLLGLERAAWETHKNLNNLANNEVAKRWNDLEQDHGKVLSELRGNLKEKGQENHRLKNSFNYVREGNDVLRQQMADLKVKNDKLEKEIASLQGRVTSLKRLKVESLSTSALQIHVSEPCLERDHSSKSVQAATPREIRKKQTPSQVPQIQAYTDSLFITLSWLTDSILSPSHLPESSNSKLSLRVTRLLSSLSEVMRYFSSLSPNHELVLVRFYYWSLYHYKRQQDASASATHITATLRRIGEECFSPAHHASRGNISKGKSSEHLFLLSPSLEVRVLSSLIVLQTLSQADTCSHTYDLFRNELRDVKAREIVLAYKIIDILLVHFISQNRILLTNSILTLLLLVVDQTQSSLQFSLALCNDHFFRATSHLLIDERLDEALKEKLAVILQRLSKLPHSLKLFERSGLEHSCAEVIRSLEPGQTFLKLNLESVLANNALARHNS